MLRIGVLVSGGGTNLQAICVGIARKDYPSVHEYGEALIQHFERCEVGLIVMAGFLSILGEKNGLKTG